MSVGGNGAGSEGPRPEPPAGWSALWSRALQRAECRRGGRATVPDEVRGEAADADGDFLAIGRADPAATGLMALYEPLLERRADSPPWVIAHLGQSLDGFIATHNGDSRFVTGAEDLDHMHRLRALSDAVVVGAGTVAIDDPQLTTRRVPGPNPVRVVLDPMGRAPPSARVLQDGAAPTLWLCDARWHDAARTPRVAAEVLPVPGLAASDGHLDARAARRALAAQGLRVLFVEGGGVTVSRFLAQCQVDRLHLTLAPVLIGEGRRGVRLPASGTMADCLRPAGRVVPLGQDVLWDFALASADAHAADATAVDAKAADANAADAADAHEPDRVRARAAGRDAGMA